MAENAIAAIPPASKDEADVYRVLAQIIRTNYPSLSQNLRILASDFCDRHAVVARRYVDVVADGLLCDLPRTRQLLETRIRAKLGSRPS
jgi:hypothetical protein